MRVFEAGVAGLWVALALSPDPAAAHRARHPGKAAWLLEGCCRVPAGTPVEVELAGVVSTKVQKSGDAFPLRLAAPLVVQGMVVLPAGTPGVGEVIYATHPGMGGKAAKLVLAARYLERRGVRASLRGLQLSGSGASNAGAANAVGLAGIALGPVGFAGLAISGGNVVFPAGTLASAKIARELTLPPLGRAPPASAPAIDAEMAAKASIAIPPPPAGQGEVVFFRRKSIMGAGQWFNVREQGKTVGKLTNGAYFIQITPPGLHTYTAKTELKDSLKLEVDPGETYFVEGMLTKGIVIGEADLSPSDRAAFEMAVKDLKPASQPSEANTGENAPGGAAPAGEGVSSNQVR